MHPTVAEAKPGAQQARRTGCHATAGVCGRSGRVAAAAGTGSGIYEAVGTIAFDQAIGVAAAFYQRFLPLGNRRHYRRPIRNRQIPTVLREKSAAKTIGATDFMKTPRELLLERHQTAQERLDVIRRRALHELAAETSPEI